MTKLFILLLSTPALFAHAQEAAAPIDLATKTDVTIPAGDVTLAATLYVPVDAARIGLMGGHVFPFANHNFTNVFSNERHVVSSVAGPWLRKMGFVQ